MIITKAELAKQLIACQSANNLTDGFSLLAMQVASGFLIRKSPALQDCERDDIVGDFCVRLVEKWRNIDSEKNIHSYLTQMCSYAALDYFRKRKRVETPLESVDAMEQHQIDALESGYLSSEDARESAQVIPGKGCDVLVNPSDGQQAMIFEGE